MRQWLLALLAVAATPAIGDAREPPPEPPDGEPPIAGPDEPPPDPDDGPAGAGPEDGELVSEDAGDGDREFGPLLVIERVDITGNTATQDEIIRRALPIATGDMLRASDRRLREARFKVLALGFFRDVTLAMTKGSAHGQVIIQVAVVERGTIVLNRLWFGTNSLSPYWMGADVGERNLLGLGVAVGAGVIYAAHGGAPGGRDQWAIDLRAADPSLRGTRLGANAQLTLVHGSEAFRIAGVDGDPADAELRAFPYRRFGFRAGLTYDTTALTRLSAGIRVEQIAADLPAAPTLTLPDDRVVPIDLHLDPGSSRVVTAGLAYDRDTRPDPILPHAGAHLAFAFELGSPVFGSDYPFATLFGRYERYWPRHGDRHAIAIKLAGGLVLGDAPRFDRVHIADVDRMLTPRALGLVLSSAAPLDLLGTRAGKPSYGDLGGSATVEYVVQLFRGRGRNRVYGGDLFFGAGLWGLAETRDLRARDSGLWDALPIDAYVDAGVRLDTDIGIFELTVANALGRLR